MAYKLNDIDFSEYGMAPGRIPGEGIAVKGLFDMPKRIGDTHYEWAENNTVEPYIDADEIKLGGITILAAFVMRGDRTTIENNLKKLQDDIDKFKTVVPFENDYRTACVYVTKITPTYLKGGATVIIEFREPIVGASCAVFIPGEETVYQSEEYSEDADKNNCDEGYHGSTVTLTAEAGKFESTVSQDAANQLAIDWVKENKQTYANAQGTCIVNPTVYYNEKLTDTKQKNDCSGGLVGSEITYEVPAFKYSSLISQADANSQAQAEIDSVFTQQYVNDNGTCLTQFYNEYVEYSLQKNDCPIGAVGETLKYWVWPGNFTSTVSQADANAQALASLQATITQEYVNENGTCSFISPSKITYLGIKELNPWFKVMQWRLDKINPGAKITFVAYGVAVEYTVQAGDTAAYVVQYMAALIDATTYTQWRSQNQMPRNSTKPDAGWEGNVLSIAYYSSTMKMYVSDNV